MIIEPVRELPFAEATVVPVTASKQIAEGFDDFVPGNVQSTKRTPYPHVLDTFWRR